MKTLISIDGGMSTGIAVGTYSDTEPYTLTDAFQIEGGVEGFLRTVSYYTVDDDFSNAYGETFFSVDTMRGFEGFVHWLTVTFDDDGTSDTVFIAEKFTARGGANQFAYRTEALEPLRIEGAILALGIDPTWVSPQHMYFADGDSKSPVTNAHRWLKEHGLYVTGKDVGCKDANDVRSAILHSVSWLRRQKHLPTLEKYFKEA